MAPPHAPPRHGRDHGFFRRHSRRWHAAPKFGDVVDVGAGAEGRVARACNHGHLLGGTIKRRKRLLQFNGGF